MAVATNMTDIDLCESTTNWSATGGPTVGIYDLANDEIAPVQGTYSIGGDVDIETGVFWFDYATSAGANQNMTNKQLYFWALCVTANFLDTKANGGLAICMRDSSNNEGYWYVGGKDTYRGGYARFGIDCGSARY